MAAEQEEVNGELPSSIEGSISAANLEFNKELRRIAEGKDRYAVQAEALTTVDDREIEPKKPEYGFQTADDIQFEAVEREDPDYGEARRVAVRDSSTTRRGLSGNKDSLEGYSPQVIEETRQSFIESTKEGLQRRCWWLSPEWQEKLGRGELSEQISVHVGDRVVDVFNFADSLDDEKTKVLSDTLARLGSVDDGALLDSIDSIILSNESGPISSNDHPTAKRMPELAVANMPSKTITMFTGGQNLTPYSDYHPPVDTLMEGDLRIPDAPTMAWVLTHEVGHLAKYSIDEEKADRKAKWTNKSGRSDFELPKSWQPIGALVQSGQTRDYALTNESEDFAETFALAFLSPESLTPDRAEYFNDIIQRPDQGEATVDKKHGANIELPRVPPVKYTLVPYNNPLV